MKRIIYIRDITCFPDNEYSLSRERKARCALLENPYEKKKFICADHFTSMILEQEFNIKNPELTGKAGKPLQVKGVPSIFISRSYAGNAMVLSFSTESLMGTDCEYIMEADFPVMNYFFTEEEREYVVRHQNMDYAFTLLWTRKEACIKCTDKGLNYPFHLLNTVPEKENTLYGSCSGFSIRSYVKDKIVISAASATDSDFPIITEYEV